MIMSLNMEYLFNQGRNHGIMDDEELIMVQDFQNISNSSSSSTINDDDDDGNSSGSSSPISPSSSSPLQEMSSLLQHLPFKRGLSKHYNGKSQSFTSLSNVNCLEELTKPENPYNKKLKTCKNYGGLIPRKNTCSRLIAKKTSTRGAYNFSSSLAGARRNSNFIGNNNNIIININNNNNNNNNNNRPPLHPPHRSTSTSGFTSHTPLFA